MEFGGEEVALTHLPRTLPLFRTGRRGPYFTAAIFCERIASTRSLFHCLGGLAVVVNACSRLS